MRLALGTGLRRSDLVKLRWEDLRGDHFKVTQQKTGEPILVGCTEELLAELETMPRIACTIIVGDRGDAITAASLSRMVRLKLRELGVTGYSIHGLRKNAGVAIAESQNSADGGALHQARKPSGSDAIRRRKARARANAQSGKLKNRTGLNEWQTH